MILSDLRLIQTCPLLIYFMGLLLFNILIGSCSKSPELENYEKCLQMLNEERLQARKSQSYTYDSQRFLECRAPAHYASPSESY